jgi:acetoin utilization deacetylase AcuC-like enzyme
VNALYYSDRYFADIGAHVMPIRKFGLVRDAAVRENLPVEIREPHRATDEELLRVHTPEYVEAIRTGEPRVLAQSQKFPWSAALAEAVRWTNGGLVDAARAALADGVAGNLASGFHHSHGPHGEGFCTFNGLVIALEAMRVEGRIQRGLVLDMDLHYGNGTAALLASRPWAFQVSIYGNWYERNFASRDVTSRTVPETENCLGVPVPNGAGREVYMELLEASFSRWIDRARPDLVLYQAGADPFREDPYSPLDLDHAALRERDRYVFTLCKSRGVPVAWVLAGGYTKDVSKVVEVHVGTVREMCGVFG